MDFDTEGDYDLIKKIHETVIESVDCKNDVLGYQNTKICLLFNIQSTKEHVHHVKKICDILSPLESKSIQVLVEEDKLLENFYCLEITEKFVEAYSKSYAQQFGLKDREAMDCDGSEEEPMSDYGDQSYDQRTSIFVLNWETLEKDYNMTQMNFFNSNFFNVKPSDLEKGQNGGSNVALKKKAENEVFSDTEYDNIEKNFRPLKKIKDDKYLNDS